MVTAIDWQVRAASLSPDARPFIGGSRVDARSGETFALESSHSGASLGSVPDCAGGDVDAAVASAVQAFESGVWSDLAALDRSKILHRFADIVGADEELALLDTVQMGMPIGMSVPDMPNAAQLLHNTAELAEHLSDVLAPGSAGALSMQMRRPQGVVGAISPWNFPVGTALTLVAPALAAGNSVVLKPSEVAPLACLRLAELAMEAGLPAGVFNAVPGRGETAGRALAMHQQVDFLGFIGSTATGQLLMQYAGQSNLKGLLLECGGKSAQIVFDDLGDIEALADALVEGFTMNSGQVCTSGSRLLIAHTLYDRLMPLLADRVRASRTGNPLDPATKLGPLASRGQARHVTSALADPAGSRLVARGTTSATDGNEVAPHLFETSDPSSFLVQHEVFGPVSVAMPFRDEDEAVALANATRYGLSATIWASDVAVSQRVVRRMRSGFVMVNRVPAPKQPGIRFLSCEPFKMSGFGIQGGALGLAAYTRVQAAIYGLE